MDTGHKECKGSLKISENAVESIALSVIRETKGVKEHIRASVPGFGRRSALVRDNGGAIEIDVYIDVEYGVNAQSCAESIQERIKSCVRDMTHVMVSKVNVKIADMT